MALSIFRASVLDDVSSGDPAFDDLAFNALIPNSRILGGLTPPRSPFRAPQSRGKSFQYSNLGTTGGAR
jgi:hypothetical protein